VEDILELNDSVHPNTYTPKLDVEAFKKGETFRMGEFCVCHIIYRKDKVRLGISNQTNPFNIRKRHVIYFPFRNILNLLQHIRNIRIF
jgi:hypothetical protein